MGIIRFVLAFSVVLSHSAFPKLFGFMPLIGGALAVETFFIISGFYMALILDGKYSSLRSFWTNRLIRLFPAYWLMAGLSVLSILIIDPSSIQSLFSLGLKSATLISLSNVLIVGQDLWLFLEHRPDGFQFTNNFLAGIPPLFTLIWLPQAWSLSLELYFYAMAPFIVKLKTRYLISMIAISICVRALTYETWGNRDPWNNRFYPSELCLFLIGMIGYRFYKRRLRAFRPMGLQEISFSNAIIYLLLASYSIFIFFYPKLPALFVGIYSAKDFTFLVVSALTVPLAFALTEKNRIDRYIGNLSFPIYICHMLVFRTFPYVGIAKKSALSQLCISLLIVALIAFLILRFIDKPLEKLRASRAR